METVAVPSPATTPAAPDAGMAGSDQAKSVPGERTLVLAVVFLLLLAGWCVYGQSLDFDFIPYDDPAYVYENQSIAHGLSAAGVRWAFTTLEQANWHPLTWLSLLVDYQMYGLNAGGYHLTNLLLHELATLLLFAWLLLATRRLWPSAGVALLFCIHPAHVESVAWVTERKDVLSTVFLFALLLAYTRYTRTRRTVHYVATLLAMVLGLLAKPMLVTVPPLLLLLDAWPLGRLRSKRDLLPRVVEKIPLAVLAGVSCVVTFLAQHHGGTVRSLAALPVVWRLSGSVTAYAVYVAKLFWPADLSVFYPYWSSLPPRQTLACLAGLAAATGACTLSYRTRPYLLVGWLWFVGTLVPVIGVVQVGSQAMADRYTYVPFVGLFVMLCWAGAEVWQRWPTARWPLAAAASAATAACLGLGYHQVGYWHNGVTLFEHAVAVTRYTSYTSDLLGDSYMRARRFPDAERMYRLSFQNGGGPIKFASKMGDLRIAENRWGEANHWLQMAAGQPACANSVFFGNLGLTFNRLGRPQEAIPPLRRSLQLQPNSANTHLYMAEALAATGQKEAAVKEYEASLKLNPGLPAALAQLAWLYSFANQEQPSAQETTRALAMAERVVGATGGQFLSGLDSLAAARAANADWKGAAVAAWKALDLVTSERPPAPDAVALHAARVKFYQARYWPVE